ncbi:MAG: sodium:calcium antiporter [Candidatus Aenigmarchaeota archaeon]|nr:sodium:calcium antiporter [Candidatus Aenigmarchaeota archaeon]
MAYESIAMFIAGFALMFFSSKWAIKYAIGISESLGLGRFAVGFIFIAITTASPEIFVAISSTLHGSPGLAVGNALGSVIANLTIVLGAAVLIGGTMKLHDGNLGDLIEILFVSALVSVFLLQTGTLSLIQGFILFTLFIFFINKIKHERIQIENKRDVFAFFGYFSRFIAAVSLLILSSELIVRASVSIAESLAVTPEFIGLTVIAVGTSLPELAVGVRAIRAREYALGLGDLFGSSVIDLTLVMGLVAMLNPVPVDLEPVRGAMPFMLTSVLISWYLLSKGRDVDRQTALALLALFTLFVLEQIGIVTLFG